VTGAPAVALRWQTATLVRRESRTSRIASFWFDAPIAASLAGQHVDVRLTADDGYSAERSYSIASAPAVSPIELAVERLDDGEVSPWFHDVAEVGDTIELRGPMGGHFVWRGADGGPLLLVGGGSGVVPLMAIARERMAHAPGVEVCFASSARTWDDHLYRDELIGIEESDPRFRLVLASTRDRARRSGDLDRRFDATTLRALVANMPAAPRLAYVCGSNPFVETVAAALVASGLAPSIIRTERYGDGAA